MSAGPVRDAIARYELGRRLGHGSMGVVYEAFDRERNRAVALKVYRHDDEVTLERSGLITASAIACSGAM